MSGYWVIGILGCYGMGWIGMEWNGMEWNGLGWVGLGCPPHDHTSSKRQPLVVADDLVRSPFHLIKEVAYIFLAAIGNSTHSTGGVDIEIDGDEDQGGNESGDGGGGGDDDVYSQHW